MTVSESKCFEESSMVYLFKYNNNQHVFCPNGLYNKYLKKLIISGNKKIHVFCVWKGGDRTDETSETFWVPTNITIGSGN